MHGARRFGSRRKAQTASGDARTVKRSSKWGMPPHPALSPPGGEGWKEELLFKAARTRSAVRGNWVTGAPAARETAFMTAAGVGVIAGSPMPLAPKGPRPWPDSRSTVMTGGASSVVGIL